MTWDPKIVLDYLRSLPSTEELSLEVLSYKLIALIALTTAHRAHTFSLIELENIDINSDRVVIKIPSLIKTSAPNRCQPILLLPYYNEDPRLCVASTLIKYIDKTKDIRSTNSNKLFICFLKNHLDQYRRKL